MTLPDWLRWMAGSSLLTVLTGAGLAESVVVAESSIELPKYVVTDSRPLPKPERWQYGTIPGFEVLSSASVRDARLVLEDLRLFEEALNVVWPALRGDRVTPITLVLCGGNHFDSFVPEEVRSQDGRQGLASLFLERGASSALVVDMGASVLTINASGMQSPAMQQFGIMASGIEIEFSDQLKRDYVHLLLSRLSPRLPPWFEEGLAQLLRGMEVSDTRIQFAKLEDPNEMSFAQAQAIDVARMNAAEGVEMALEAPAEDRGFQAALARSRLMGFPELFAVKRDSALARNPVGSAWAKQCYAFVHLCLYGRGHNYQSGFLKFVARLAKEEPSEQLFKECFGVSYRSMGATLRGYVNGASYEMMEWRALKGSKGFKGLEPVVLREATQAEVGRIKGETYLIAGHRERAQVELVTAYRRGVRAPELLAALGLFEANGGDSAKAVGFLQAAAAQKVERADVYLTLARERYQHAAQRAGDGEVFAQEDVLSIASLLTTGERHPAATVEIYELLADTGDRSPAPIDVETVKVLVRGSVKFHRRLKLVYQTTRFCAEVDLRKEAHALADYGIENSQSPKAKESFTQLKATLPPLASEESGS
jgi:hypothetical protein